MASKIQKDLGIAARRIEVKLLDQSFGKGLHIGVNQGEQTKSREQDNEAFRSFKKGHVSNASFMTPMLSHFISLLARNPVLQTIWMTCRTSSGVG
jgi:hypothetical protein